MFEEHHPLYGKDTTCHKCDGPAFWVFNGGTVGNYHYCRACKIETGPFAKVALPTLEAPPRPKTFLEELTELEAFFGGTMDTAIQAALDTQARWEQLSFDLTGDEEGLIGCQDDGDCDACYEEDNE